MTSQAIVRFEKDGEDRWFAILACGHTQHVHHDPPWQVRRWTETVEGRDSMLGHTLPCKLCDATQTGKRALESESFAS